MQINGIGLTFTGSGQYRSSSARYRNNATGTKGYRVGSYGKDQYAKAKAA